MEYASEFPLMPEDTQGWNGTAPIFGELIAEVLPSVIIEVGSWKGQSTITMAKECKARGMGTQIWCVDTWEGSLEFPLNEKLYGSTDWGLKPDKDGKPQILRQFTSNLHHAGVRDRIVIVQGKSAEVPETIVFPPADLIYIDADHTYEGVKADLEAYWPLLKPGGIMFGDDFSLKVSGGRVDGYECGVQQAVEEFVKSNIIRSFETAVGDNFWIIRK